MRNRKDPIDPSQVSEKNRIRVFASDEGRRMSTLQSIKLTSLFTLAAACFALMTACTGALTVKPTAATTPRIVPAANGFVVCANCDNFDPTPKHVKAPARIKEAAPKPSVPVASSIAPDEQIVAVNAIGAVAKPPAITILFDSNQARIRPAEAKKLRMFLHAVDAGAAFVVAGYTDATGTVAANKQLAGRRAAAVRDFVARNTHLQRVTITEAVACCSGASDKTSAERAMNRHVDLEISP